MPRKRFALIGAGLFGEMHARAYTSHPEAELGVICDLNGDREKQVAEEYGVARHTDNWREVAQDPSIDAASVATPDFAHTEIAVALAKAGKHLLVEKPVMSRNLSGFQDARTGSPVVSSALAGVPEHNRLSVHVRDTGRGPRGLLQAQPPTPPPVQTRVQTLPLQQPAPNTDEDSAARCPRACRESGARR